MIKKRRSRRLKRIVPPVKMIPVCIPDPPFVTEFDWDKIMKDVPLIPDTTQRYDLEEPYFDCCKGCPNWKGAFTVCNCTLPTMEMNRKGFGNFNNTITVIEID
jgi:hypothetical protein